MSNCDFLQCLCDNCGEVAHEPYIECCECATNLCTACFGSGRQVRDHKNYHKYAIRRNDFTLFENCNWSAREECNLLEAISIHGYGNWEEVAKSVQPRSKLECQEHYKKYYIDNVQHKELDIIPETVQSVFPQPVIPFLYSRDVCNDPPRNIQGEQHLAGYNAFRSEFELNYDNQAETIFNVMENCSDSEDEDLMDALQVSMFTAFNNRLKERHRRYKIIKEHGLILPNKLNCWLQSFDRTLTRAKSEKMVRFMQFMKGVQFDAFMETLSLEAELLQKIVRLCEYRRNGIKTLHGAEIYNTLKPEHELVLKEQKQFTAMMSRKFDSQSPLKHRMTVGKDMSGRRRRHILPLDIIDLPGFQLLTDSEKELCSKLRLLPENYMEIKKLLIQENEKIGCLKLLDARRIIKIDVNKTRKIYDYLIEQGFITKQPNKIL